MENKDYISDELLAAYLDGNTSEEETMLVLKALKTDEHLQEVLNIALQTEEDIPLITIKSSFSNESLPIRQMAALSGENVCAVLCEIYILQRHHISFDEEWLINTARKKGWLKTEGTPLYCLGNLLAYSGMLICRQYDSTIEDIKQALRQENDVMVGVDREKLYAEEIDPEDLTNHAVVVTSIENRVVTIFDPYNEPYVARIPLASFINAWKESHYYMIKVLQSVEEYEPHPINVDSIPLDGDLEELQEAIAENAHNVWAEAKIKQGWSYGQVFDEDKKLDPCLIPYTALPENEKVYDRLTAFNTIKLVKKLGFNILKQK